MELVALDGLGRLGIAPHWYRSELRQLVHALAEKRNGLADPPPRQMRERACDAYESIVVQLEERDGLKVSMIGPPPTRKQVRSMKKVEMNDGRRLSRRSLSGPEVERLERTRREVIVNSFSGLGASWTNRTDGPVIELVVSMQLIGGRFHGALMIPDGFAEKQDAQDVGDRALQSRLSGRPLVRTWTCPWKE